MILEFLKAALAEQKSHQIKLDQARVLAQSPRAVLNEHATIRLSLHRQAGHSTAVRQLVAELQSCGAEPLVITLSVAHNRLYPGCQTMGREQALSAYYGVDTSLVIMDGTHNWSATKLDKLAGLVAGTAYKRLTTGLPFAFVLLQ